MHGLLWALSLHMSVRGATAPCKRHVQPLCTVRPAVVLDPRRSRRRNTVLFSLVSRRVPPNPLAIDGEERAKQCDRRLRPAMALTLCLGKIRSVTHFQRGATRVRGQCFESSGVIVNACACRLGSRAGPRTGKEERGFLQKTGRKGSGPGEVKAVKGV